MSMDKSLKSKNTLQRHRNVLTRAERIRVLKETTSLHLPKIAHRKAAVGKKDKTAKKTEAEDEKTETP